MPTIVLRRYYGITTAVSQWQIFVLAAAWRQVHHAIFLPRWSHVRRICPANTDISGSSVTCGTTNNYYKGTRFPILGGWFLTRLETRLLRVLLRAAWGNATPCGPVLPSPLTKQLAWTRPRTAASENTGEQPCCPAIEGGLGRICQLGISVPFSKADRAHLKSNRLSHSCCSSCKTVRKLHCSDGKKPFSHFQPKCI